MIAACMSLFKSIKLLLCVLTILSKIWVSSSSVSADSWRPSLNSWKSTVPLCDLSIWSNTFRSVMISCVVDLCAIIFKRNMSGDPNRQSYIAILALRQNETMKVQWRGDHIQNHQTHIEGHLFQCWRMSVTLQRICHCFNHVGRSFIWTFNRFSNPYMLQSLLGRISFCWVHE